MGDPTHRGCGRYRSVSIVVGMIVTDSLNRAAYSARYGFPAITRAAMRQIDSVFRGDFSRLRYPFDGLTYRSKIASSKSKTTGTPDRPRHHSINAGPSRAASRNT